MTKAAVEELYERLHAGTTKTLCVSHERLRAELEGMDVLLKDDNALVLLLKGRIARALTMCDNGWSVDEIRAALLGE